MRVVPFCLVLTGGCAVSSQPSATVTPERAEIVVPRVWLRESPDSSAYVLTWLEATSTWPAIIKVIVALPDSTPSRGSLATRLEAAEAWEMSTEPAGQEGELILPTERPEVRMHLRNGNLVFTLGRSHALARLWARRPTRIHLNAQRGEAGLATVTLAPEYTRTGRQPN